MIQPRPEVLVIGGGPAGASAARLLATWGHRVRVETREASEARLAESLPPSCGKLFDAIGIAEAIERAAFIRSTGNTVWWGSDAPRVELFAEGGRGWQIEAERLAAVLLDEAMRAGVKVERQTLTPDGIPRPPSLVARGLSFRLRQGYGGPPKLQRRLVGATRTTDEERPFVLDCSGRSGLLARAHGLRVYDEGPRTIALVASWHDEGHWNVPDPSHTVVESYEGGWAWSVPTAPKHRHVAVMVDPERSGLARGGSARAIYLAEVAKTREFRSLLRGATVDAGPWGFDASTYHAQCYAGDDWLLVGDAGSFIDPLSSAGVKKALASGWLAAIVAHTCLTRPEMRSHALSFFDAREAEIQQRFAAMTRQMLSDAAAGHAHRFWADRWDETRATPGVGRATPGVEHATPGVEDDEASVRSAFEQLRRRDAFHVRRGPDVVVEQRPAVSGCEIVLEPRLVSLAIPSGIRFVRDVDVIALIDLAPSYSEVPDLFDAYCRTSGPVALPDFLRALATALARGWLVAE